MIHAVSKRKMAVDNSMPEQTVRHRGTASQRTHFEDELLTVASRLRGEMAALFAALPTPVTGGTDIKRQLGLANTASWQLHSFVSATNPVAAVGQLPGRVAMTRLMQAAKRKGLDQSLISRVGEAFDGFDAFVKEHARDRATLDALATGLSQDDGESAAADLRWRRSALRDNSHIWGIQARSTLLCGIYHMGGDRTKVDGVLIPGLVGLHALRRNVPFRLMGNAGVYDASDPEAARKPLRTPGVEQVLTEFSSKPLPRLETSRGFNGMAETSLRFDGVGKAASVDIFTVLRIADAYAGKPQPWFGNTRGIAVPSEVLVLDLIVPKDWTNPSTVCTSTHGNVSMYEGLVPRAPREFVMPVKEEAVYLGNDLRSIETTDVPRYPEMVRSVLSELGWQATTFDIYRTRVRFPIMHSLVHMHADAVKM